MKFVETVFIPLCALAIVGFGCDGGSAVDPDAGPSGARGDQTVTDDGSEITYFFEDRGEIPDGSAISDGTVSSRQDIDASGRIEDLEISVALAHTSPGDLYIELAHDFEEHVIWDGTSGDQLAEDGGIVISGDRLEPWIGKDLAGEWTLTVADTDDFNGGHLFGWSLTAELEDRDGGGSSLDPLELEGSPGSSIRGDLHGANSITASYFDTEEGGEVSGVELTTRIVHDDPNDLEVYLAHAGSVVKVFDGNVHSGGGDTLNFDRHSVDGFEGAPVSGEWELYIIDSDDSSFGTLHEWGLRIQR